jgi:ABC-type multidrug transport system fused ATPase/permease subunit
MKLPNKYDTFVGQKGYELSGGQKQRIAIARAFYKQSKILLFDEATSSLDGNSEDMIQNAFESASQDRTIIIIAHRLQTIRNAHKIVVLDEGSVREIGAFDDLYKDGTFFYELVKSKASFN